MFLAGVKTCTRRDWDAGYAARFQSGEYLKAYDRSPRARGNHIGVIQLTQKPILEPLSVMTDSDYEAEGFAWALAHPEALTRTVEGLSRDHFIREVCTKEGFERWRNSGQTMWTVRFQLVELTDEGKRQADSCLIQAGLFAPQKDFVCR
jgi:hypothetical protein